MSWSRLIRFVAQEDGKVSLIRSFHRDCASPLTVSDFSLLGRNLSFYRSIMANLSRKATSG